MQTQMTYQQHQEPFLAVVVDPVRTCASGKVDIGAFRTYPAGHTVEDGPGEYQPLGQLPLGSLGAKGRRRAHVAIKGR